MSSQANRRNENRKDNQDENKKDDVPEDVEEVKKPHLFEKIFEARQRLLDNGKFYPVHIHKQYGRSA